jgi:hypothetical protein
LFSVLTAARLVSSSLTVVSFVSSTLTATNVGCGWCNIALVVRELASASKRIVGLSVVCCVTLELGACLIVSPLTTADATFADLLLASLRRLRHRYNKILQANKISTTITYTAVTVLLPTEEEDDGAASAAEFGARLAVGEFDVGILGCIGSTVVLVLGERFVVGVTPDGPAETEVGEPLVVKFGVLMGSLVGELLADVGILVEAVGLTVNEKLDGESALDAFESVGLLTNEELF